nr:hypothetical protein Iba_chr10cCG1910 [Ipomoea batatas]
MKLVLRASKLTCFLARDLAADSLFFIILFCLLSTLFSITTLSGATLFLPSVCVSDSVPIIGSRAAAWRSPVAGDPVVVVAAELAARETVHYHQTARGWTGDLARPPKPVGRHCNRPAAAPLGSPPRLCTQSSEAHPDSYCSRVSLNPQIAAEPHQE